ncbi:26S proteasome regulatory subunit N12 [Strigomonas culicis]|nr:26S proteasome regulatory subunit N12 [Strigomonas culicis]|eukprot:EPY25682.1 26S proteasome regulatory subunit N12 [Strigomonas culicis]
MLAREVLELGVLVGAKRRDLDMCELYFNQLQLYYTDVDPSELPESPLCLKTVGLNLVRLLVTSHIAQFHSELERIPHDVHASNIYIRFAVLLERYLMEGSYHKLLNSRKNVPSSEYIPLVEMLDDTVRKEVADCIPHSYKKLSVVAAQKIMMMNSLEEVLAIGKNNQWSLSDDKQYFLFNKATETDKFIIER